MDGFLFHGDYHYDPTDPHDCLNGRAPMDGILQAIDTYHFYQQQTQGGILSLLTASYTLIRC